MPETPVAGRLGIRPGSTLWFSPIEWLHLLGPLPPGVRMTGEYAGANVAVMFVSSAGSVQWFLRRYGTVVTMPPAVWMCTPTRERADFNRAYLATMLGSHGLHSLAEISIDAAWTATRIGIGRSFAPA